MGRRTVDAQMTTANTAPASLNYPRIIGAGLVAGTIAGLFGVGGGIVIVPALVIIAHLGQRLASGTSLASIIVIAAAGTVGYAIAGEVRWPVSLAMALGGLGGAVLGTKLLQHISQRKLQYLFAGLLVATALRLVLGSTDGTSSGELTAVGFVGFLALGFGAGVIAGVLGVGGGIVTVPLLTVVAGLPLVVAKGTSLAAIVPTAAVGTVRNHRAGNTDLKAAALVAGGGMITSFAASQLALGLSDTLSAWLFAGLLMVTATRMVLKARSTAPADRHGS